MHPLRPVPTCTQSPDVSLALCPDFPWRIRPLSEALADPVPLVNGSGPLPPVDKPLLAHDYNVLYFSAGWSVPALYVFFFFSSRDRIP